MFLHLQASSTLGYQVSQIITCVKTVFFIALKLPIQSFLGHPIFVLLVFLDFLHNSKPKYQPCFLFALTLSNLPFVFRGLKGVYFQISVCLDLEVVLSMSKGGPTWICSKRLFLCLCFSKLQQSFEMWMKTKGGTSLRLKNCCQDHVCFFLCPNITAIFQNSAKGLESISLLCLPRVTILLRL